MNLMTMNGFAQHVRLQVFDVPASSTS